MITLTTRPEELPLELIFDVYQNNNYWHGRLDDHVRAWNFHRDFYSKPELLQHFREELPRFLHHYSWQYGSHVYHHQMLPYFMAKQRGETNHGKTITWKRRKYKIIYKTGDYYGALNPEYGVDLFHFNEVTIC